MQSDDPQFDQARALIQAGRAPEAAVLLDRLAAADDMRAIVLLAELKWTGALDRDPLEARRLFERAAALGHQLATERATNLLASGIAGQRDWSGALARLRLEAAHQPQRRLALDLIEAMNLDTQGEPLALPAATPLSSTPRVARIEQLLTPAECDYVQTLNRHSFKAATVYDARRKLMRDPIRTSDESTINWLIEDPAVHALNRRLAAVSGSATEQGEAAQILRYQPGQQYRAHYDFLPNAANQRIATVLVYLNDKYSGGETAFCKTGLQVSPRQGDALFFLNTCPDGTRDDMAEHAGLPVTFGVKFLLSRWIRAERWAP